MLSALIPSIHSYSAVHLVVKPIDQRYVQPSPLVLRSTPLKYKTPVTDRDRPVSRNSTIIVITNGLDYTIISIYIETLDVLARQYMSNSNHLRLSLYGVTPIIYRELPSVLSYKTRSVLYRTSPI